MIELVTNITRACEVCGTVIKFRFQVDRVDIPVSVYCPDCNTHIFGLIRIEQDKFGIHPEINHISNDEKGNPKYIMELSSTFFMKKSSLYTGKVDLTPFLRSLDTKDDWGNVQRINKILDFSLTTDKRISNLNRVMNLWNNDKKILLKKQLMNDDEVTKNIKSAVSNYVFRNDLDLLMGVHNYMIFTVIPVMSNHAYHNLVRVMRDIFDNMSPFSLISYSKYLNDNNYYSQVNFKVVNLIDKFLVLMPKLIPVISKYDTISEIDFDIYGVTTISYNELVTFYVELYEFFAEYVDIIIGLNNIYHRGDYEVFNNSDDISDFKSIIDSFGSKYGKYTANVKFGDKFSASFIGILDNKIRNSIAHNNHFLDGVNQTLTFKDEYRGRVREHKMPFGLFAYKTVLLFNKVMELNEYYYQVEKVYRMYVKNEMQSFGVKKR